MLGSAVRTNENEEEGVKFTNPRSAAVVGRFTYKVCYDPKKGCRISRQGTGRPKFTTYCEAASFVDGDGGDGDDGGTSTCWNLLAHSTVSSRSKMAASWTPTFSNTVKVRPLPGMRPPSTANCSN